MSVQGKSRRRLLFMLIGVLVLAGLAGGGALVRMQYIRQNALRGRADGLADMTQGDYPSALTHLGKYLSRYPNDTEILLPYAKARQSVEEPNGRHLGQAIALYQRVLELSPGLTEAQNHLLELYLQVGFNTEANGLADTLLAKDPGNTGALRGKVIALMRLNSRDPRNQKAAKDAVANLTKADPLNLDFRILELQIKLNIDGSDKIMSDAEDIARAYPHDDRFELLMSIAASFAGNARQATDIVKPLAERPQVDAAYTRVLVRQLDSLQLFAESYHVLDRASHGSLDRETTRTWIRRLFETNRFPLLIEQTAAINPSDRATDPETIAMRALALARLNRRPDAQEIVTILEKRGVAEPPAARWAAALHATALRDSSDPIQTIGWLRDALIASPGNPILFQELGDAYAAAGAHDKASDAWREAARTAPAWAAPLVRLSQSLIAAGRPDDALTQASAASNRDPEGHDALVALAIASAARLPKGPSAEATNVLKSITEIQRKFPKDAELLPLQAGVLAQTQGPQAASKIIQSALAAEPIPPERVLLSLAQVSENFGLGQEEVCWAAGEKAYGLTADLAFARALWLNRQKRDAEALAVVEHARSAHPANDPLWQSMWAQYLDLIHDDRAKSVWEAVGEGNPKNAKLQWAALSARAVQDDHDFVGRTLDRLVTLLGDDSLTLRLMRARWLLHEGASEADITKASILLSDITRGAPGILAPHLLLAACYTKLGNSKGAIDQMVIVSDMEPQLARVALDLADLLQRQGDSTRAGIYIDRACASKQATTDDKYRAVHLLAKQHDFKKALALLEDTYQGKPPLDIFVAALYQQNNQPKKAEEICRQLLEKPDLNIIAFAADFYASQNQPAEAQRVLALLDSVPLPAGSKPGDKEYILAQYTARYGSPEEAMKRFQAAAEADPHEIGKWQQWVMYCLSTGRIDDAIAAANEATGKLNMTSAAAEGSAASFETLRLNTALVKEAAKIPGIRPLLMATLSTDPAVTAPVLEALQLVVTAKQQNDPLAQTADKLRKMADRYPKVLALQSVTLQLYMDSGQLDKAVALATRIVQAFPSAVEPLREATRVMGAAGRWDDALNMAMEWQRRDSGDPLEADLAIAGAELRKGEGSLAAQQMQPYVERALREPDKFSGVLLLRAHALIMSGHPEQIEPLLGPLLAKSGQWRHVWMSLAVNPKIDLPRGQNWLDQVTPFVTDDLNERSMLALAWIQVGKNARNMGLQQKGHMMLQSIAELPDAPAQTLLEWGSACEASGDWTGAENAYRRALQKEPASPVALNNLAMVLVRNHGSLQEAQQLIAKALEKNPEFPPFLDTQASVQAANGDITAAIASLQKAQKLDPKSIEWHLNLVAIYVNYKQLASAKQEFQTIDASLVSDKGTPPEIRQRYAAFQAQFR